jgi:hypothetical protein
MTALLLAEHAHQVRDFIDRGLAADSRWVALGPAAMASLDELGVSYQIPEDFYSVDEFANFCDETHRQVEFLCEQLDDRLLTFYPELNARNLRPFRFHIFPLMMIFDAVRGRIFQLEKIFGGFRGHTVHIHHQDLQWRGPGLIFDNAQTLWGQVAAITKGRACLKTFPELQSHRSSGNGGGSVRSRIKNSILKSISLTSAARLIDLRNYRGLLSFMRSGGGALLVVNAPYEWTPILMEFTKERRRVIFITDNYFQSSGQFDESAPRSGGFDEALSDAEIGACFRYEEVGYQSLLRPQLHWIWDHSPRQFLATATCIEALQHRHSVSALLRCSSASGLDHAINQSARNLGIPVFTWQHGAVSYSTRITQFRDYADRMTADFTFVYGEQAEAAYTQYGREFSARVVPIGAPSLDSISRVNRGKQQRSKGQILKVLYATTNFMQNHWYCGWDPPFSDRIFFRDQALIVSYLQSAAEAGGAEIVIKLHPSYEYSEPPWVAKITRVKGIHTIKDQGSFETLLAEADAVVLDFPSTVLLQSIATSLPVFVLVRHWQFPHAVRERLQRRAIVCDSAAELVNRLQEFIETSGYPADPQETSFLQGFGTYLNDGRSHERALNLVSTILESGSLAPGAGWS